ncbi:MAG: hypothetical protein JKY53_01310 [Flavobacteriales bacterium]|nr:hypothetical protein [Flavobacteriales bacterium]
MLIFKSFSKKKKLSHFRNLAAMAHTDNHFDDNEKKLLISLAKKYDISENEIDLVLSENEINFIQPTKLKDKLEQIFQLVLMMLADGKVLPEEKAFCVSCCQNLDLHDHVANDMLNYVKIADNEGYDGDKAFEFILSKFSSVRD